MSKKKMPEAAQLYFKDWDVLDTAREELISVLDEFWPATWPVIQERLQDSPAEEPRIWENKASPGQWSLGYGPGKQPRGTKRKLSALKMDVRIWDPRMSDNTSCYEVGLACSFPSQRELEHARPGAKAAIGRAAKKFDLTLDWDTPEWLWGCEVAIDPMDLTATWDKVASEVVELLCFLHEGNKWVRKNV